MIVIKIKGHADTPHVILDAENGVFEISGKSMPEDVNAFYEPILEWLNEYKESPNDNTEFLFRMNYFNSASSKYFHDIMRTIQDIYSQGKEAKITWNFDEDDEAMEEAGEEFKDLIKVPFIIQSN